MATRVGIAGIAGRMGQELYAASSSDDDIQLIGGVVEPELLADTNPELKRTLTIVDDVHTLLPQIDVLIDFTSASATLQMARACAEVGRPFVSGVTGLSDDQLAELKQLAQRTPIFYSRNMSVGLNAILAILPALINALDGYDIEIMETHHHHKKDAPSGTALAIAEVIAAARERALTDIATYGRHGLAPRQPGEIGIHALRAGGNSGEHVVLFADEGEEIRLTHHAYSRRTFALGALRAARFIVQQSPGFYTMNALTTHRATD